MRSGRLSHKITIQNLVLGSPQTLPSGKRNDAWTDYLADIWAEWVTLRGGALFTAQAHHAEVNGIWRIRWRDGITSKMRIVHNSLYYEILYVPPFDRNGKKVDMELECSEGLSSG